MRRNPKKEKAIASERIKDLLDFAFKVKEQSLRNRYVQLVRKYAMKTNLRLKPEQKMRFCKHCKEYLVLGENSNIRLRKSRVIIYCHNCKKYTRRPYK
jgi:ribonuclease P protein subunit RPR2